MIERHTTSLGEVITFYSYKGGTGRSMLLANVAWQLASAGRKVLVVDWDLEAPGLHRYFKPFLGDDPELRSQDGVIEWVLDYWDSILDLPEDANIENVVRDYADPRSYVRRLETDDFVVGGGIDLLGPGRQDGGYAAAVADFNWTRLFEKLHGAAFIEAAKRILVGEGGYDYVLVDARTGVSDTSGFCTVALADTLVVCFTYNNQSVIGASNIARDIKRKAEDARAISLQTGGTRRFRLFAVPSRVDDLDPERLERRQRHAWGLFADLLTDVPADQQQQYWGSVQIRNQGLFSYEEVLAACMNRTTDPQSLLGSVTQLTRYLTDDSFSEAPALSDDQRASLRERFAVVGEQTDRDSRPTTAWVNLLQRVSDPTTREALLEACFPILVQLYTTAAQPVGTGPDPIIVRTSLLESELTADERRMGDALVAAGVAQRRITEDRQRGLAVSDESVFSNWAALRERILAQCSFMTAREQIRQARRTWEASGRSIQQLRSLHGDFLRTQFTDEQGAWLGGPNLQFLQALRDAHATAAAQSELEAKLAQKDEEARAHTISLLAENEAREQRVEVRIRSAVIGATAIVAGLLLVLAGGLIVFVLHRSSDRIAALDEQLSTAKADAASSKQMVDQLTATIAAERAKVYFAEGSRLAYDARRTHDYSKAIQMYGKAIEADPLFAEAYRGRALVLANVTGAAKDVNAELADWARFYDLRPSLDRRSKWIVQAIKRPEVDTQLIMGQLEQLLSDASNASSRDASPKAVAARLEAAIEDLPPDAKAHALEILARLSSVQWTGRETVAKRTGTPPAPPKL